MGKSNFTDTMDRAKTTAMVARNRGMATGKAAKGWNRKRPHHTPVKGTWERLLGETKARWNHERGMIAADYSWACNPSAGDVEEFIAGGGTL